MIPEFVLELDKYDVLAHKRDEFNLPDGVIYLDGNSLGPLSKHTQQHLQQVVQSQWGTDLIKSWNTHQWIDLPSKVGEKIAPLIGAAPGQVICCDSISVNLFKLLSGALKINSERRVILSLKDNFPTDLYIAQGLSQLLGTDRCELKQVELPDLLDQLDDSVSVLLLTQVNFRTGDLLDIQAITQYAHEHGILVVWDLAHSAGALPLELDKHQVDFAVGCGYKYFNGGPGAPAFVYVNQRIQERIRQPLTGWMGHRAPFQFDNEYQPSKGVSHFLSGTPNILSLAGLDAAMDAFSGVDMGDIRNKSIALSELFLRLVSEAESLTNLECISPLDAQQRGSQLSFAHPQAHAICQALIAQDVVADFRAPNIVRFGFTPLYQRFADIWQAVKILNQVVSSERYLKAEFQQRQKVT